MCTIYVYLESHRPMDGTWEETYTHVRKHIYTFYIERSHSVVIEHMLHGDAYGYMCVSIRTYVLTHAKLKPSRLFRDGFVCSRARRSNRVALLLPQFLVDIGLCDVCMIVFYASKHGKGARPSPAANSMGVSCVRGQILHAYCCC